MKRPFYLGTRSLVLFEAALREVRTDELPAVLEQVSSKSSPVYNPRKQKIVEAELVNRKAADHAALMAAILSGV